MSYFLVPVLASYPMKIGFGSEQLAVFFSFLMSMNLKQIIRVGEMFDSFPPCVSPAYQILMARMVK